jgi:hypothetical protein
VQFAGVKKKKPFQGLLLMGVPLMEVLLVVLFILLIITGMTY